MKFSLLMVLFFSLASMAHDHGHEHKHEHKGLAAHQHGHVTLEMAIDGNQAVVEIHGTAESFIGFEHKPKSKSEKKTLESLEKKLKDQGLELIGFAADLECKQEKHTVDWHYESAHEHEHDHDKKHGTHGELKASYEFKCKNAIVKTKLTVALKKVFERIQKVELAVIPSNGNAFARDLTKDQESVEIP